MRSVHDTEYDSKTWYLNYFTKNIGDCAAPALTCIVASGLCSVQHMVVSGMQRSRMQHYKTDGRYDIVAINDLNCMPTYMRCSHIRRMLHILRYDIVALTRRYGGPQNKNTHDVRYA